MMEDMKSQDFVQKFTVMMQELEQRQEVLRKKQSNDIKKLWKKLKRCLLAYSLATLQEVTVATIKNNVNPDTKPTIFVTASFPPSTPSNLQSNFPKLSGSGDKFDLLPIPIIQLPKLPVYLQEIQNWSIMKFQRNYENCVDFDLSDHDYITLKEDEFREMEKAEEEILWRV
ncbi:hypothetical protein GH714_033856 [Hevea brasiliensis]|uniref:Uncharacterized protein n=1 Tax=Hevea brasiliensis TaxID=3981 RepID=A0A6A6NDH4_HEVBR|nr:hypothetical protein GH714_033856 [Hevea brasiliensis]